MQLKHDFAVPAPIQEAWDILMDVERVAPCMPGARLTSHSEDEFTGDVRVKLGPITVSYGMTGRFVVQDAQAHRAVIEARGKEQRGNGTAAVQIELTLVAVDERSTNACVAIDLDITGRPAQFGRSTLSDVSAALVADFAGRLARTLSATDVPAAHGDSAPAAADAATEPPSPDPSLDLLRVVALPLIRRNGAAIVVALLALLFLGRLLRRRH